MMRIPVIDVPTVVCKLVSDHVPHAGSKIGACIKRILGLTQSRGSIYLPGRYGGHGRLHLLDAVHVSKVTILSRYHAPKWDLDPQGFNGLHPTTISIIIGRAFGWCLQSNMWSWGTKDGWWCSDLVDWFKEHGPSITMEDANRYHLTLTPWISKTWRGHRPHMQGPIQYWGGATPHRPMLVLPLVRWSAVIDSGVQLQWVDGPFQPTTVGCLTKPSGGRRGLRVCIHGYLCDITSKLWRPVTKLTREDRRKLTLWWNWVWRSIKRRWRRREARSPTSRLLCCV